MHFLPTFITLITIHYAYSAKILGIFPMTARSHYILGSSLMKALAERGHEVTLVSPFGEKEPPKNTKYTDIILTGFEAEHDKKIKQLDVFGKKKIHPLLMAPLMAKFMIDMTEQTLNHTNVQKLIHSDETFDVIIVEEFMNHAHKAFANHFKGHLVLLSTMGASNWINNLVGNPTPLSYLPDPISGYSHKMTFCQRLINTVSYLIRELIQYVYAMPKQNELVKKYFPGELNLYEIMYNASLILVNSHISTNSPVPYVPQMIDIGGFHVKPPKKLPKDLQDYLDNSDGVIYFSLGSNMKSSLLPEEKIKVFIDTFSKLKLDVLWKWEQDELPGKPQNVKIGKWLPQQDILAHPNVKFFMTHAGLLSTTETIYHGVPVLAIPLGGDQNLNAQQIVNQGFGLMVSFHEVTEDALTENIQQLLNNSTYRKNAQERSRLFHDRLVKPMETAVYWVEYVLSHGTSHLRVAGLDLPFYKYLLLDVIAVLVMIILVLAFITVKIVKIVMKLFKRDKYKVKTQ